MLAFCWSHAVSREGQLSVKGAGSTITVTLPFRNRSDISPVLQQMLQILPSSPGADLRFVGPEAYAIYDALFKKRNTKVRKQI